MSASSKTLPGYRGMGPVRVGNQAHVQDQHDVYGQIVLASCAGLSRHAPAAPSRMKTISTRLESVGDRAYALYAKPDAGLWEFRGRAAAHTYSALMCWAACDRLANAAQRLGLDDRAPLWRGRAKEIRTAIEDKGLERGAAAASPHARRRTGWTPACCNCVETRFLSADDPRFHATLAVVEKHLRRGAAYAALRRRGRFRLARDGVQLLHLLVDRGAARVGRRDEARALFEEMLARRTSAGLLSEDCDFSTGEPWGNYPQTYSLAGLINCAVLLSNPWSTVR